MAKPIKYIVRKFDLQEFNLRWNLTLKWPQCWCWVRMGRETRHLWGFKALCIGLSWWRWTLAWHSDRTPSLGNVCLLGGCGEPIMVLKGVWWQRCLPLFLKSYYFRFSTMARLVSDQQKCTYTHLQDVLSGQCSWVCCPTLGLCWNNGLSKWTAQWEHALPKTGRKVRHVGISSPPVH